MLSSCRTQLLCILTIDDSCESETLYGLVVLLYTVTATCAVVVTPVVTAAVTAVTAVAIGLACVTWLMLVVGSH